MNLNRAATVFLAFLLFLFMLCVANVRAGDDPCKWCVCSGGTIKPECLSCCGALTRDPIEEQFWLLAENKKGEVGPNLSACEAMAQLYDEIGKMTKWCLDDIVLYTGKVLAPGVSFHDVVIVPPGIRPFISLGYSGFRSHYVDTPPTSQSHHFVGYFGLGAKLPVGLVTEFFTECRELGLRECLFWLSARDPGNEPADYQLGVVATNLAQRMRDAPHLVRGLGGAIRTTICISPTPPPPPGNLRIIPP